MKTLESRSEEPQEEKANQRRRRITVNILGRGEDSLSVRKGMTVGELRNNLGIGNNVRAVDDDNNILSDTSALDSHSNVNFVPNVKGGNGED